jgi:nitrate reductase beta subunit
MRYMASLFAAGNESVMTAVFKKLMAVRLYKREQRVGDVSLQEVNRAMAEALTTPEEAEAIFRLTSLPTFKERFVIPPLAREVAIESVADPFAHKTRTGVGFRQPPQRGW